MAEQQSDTKQALKKLEDQLTCAICLDSYTDPKLLQCFHVFCKDCLTRLVVQDRQGQLSLTCPNCRQPTPLQADSSVSGLQPAFHIHHLQDIQDAFKKVKEPEKVKCEKCTKTSRVATSFCRTCGKFICTQCANMHAEWEDFSDHQVISIEQMSDELTCLVPPKKVTLNCSQHNGKELELYCETCEELICHNCTVRLHQGHQYDLVSDTFEKHKGEITASLEPVEKQLTIVNKALEQVDIRRGQISDQQAAIKDNIHKSIRELIVALEARETELIGQVDQIAQLKLKHLAAQKDEVEMIQAQLSSCLSFVRESLRTGCQGEVLKIKKPVVKQIKEMATNFKPDNLEASEFADMKFSMRTEFQQACQRFGTVYIEQVSPEKCHVTGKGLEVAVTGEKSTVILHAVDQKGQPCEQPIEALRCELVSTTTPKTIIKCSVDKVDKSQYKIVYEPTTRGKHMLHIEVEGEHIKGSPFTVVVKVPVEQLGTPIKTIGGVKHPWGVAINQRGEIIVAEYGRNCVSIFSPSGEKLRAFGTQGSGEGQFNHPEGIVVDGDGNILVADFSNNRIQKFSSDGQFITVVGSKGSKPLQVGCHVGIGINPSNNKVYVVEYSNHRIQVLNPDLTFSNSFGSGGSGNGQFRLPYDIAFDSTGNVYVADRNNHRIQVFTAEGGFLRKFGKQGRGDGELSSPVGVSIDADDLLYVSDYANHCVCVFTCNGVFVTSFGTKGTGPGQFNSPYGIAVDKSGVVFVCDSGNNRVQCF